MHVITAIDALREVRQSLSGKIGLVTTMGYLHQGHLSLVQTALAECDHVIVTIFVNPTQFAANEDLSSYPRDIPRDLALLDDVGVDVVFMPTPELMYPPGYQTSVAVTQVSQGLEGATRPEHFRGVATVVTKLFNLTQPDVAYFGQKDAQQALVIRQLVLDLNIPITIRVCPIIREPDGLAMSSRNVYLSHEERQVATILSQTLNIVQSAYDQGERHPAQLLQIAHNRLTTQPQAHVDYVSLTLAHNLAPVESPTEEPLLLAIAAQVGKPRLLDNCLLPPDLNTMEGASKIMGTSS